jgi:hypothetical protein
MANKILKTTGYEVRIRSKMGVDAAYLPDADINQPDIITIAEANIIETVPDYDDLTGDDLVYLEAATVCECAILLCPSMPVRLPAREQGPSFSRDIEVDWDKKKSKLETDRDAYLSRISTVTYTQVPHFGLC